MFGTVLLTTALLVPIINQSHEERVFMRYRAALDAYAELHRTAAESSMPEGGLCGGPEQIELMRRDLAAEIRTLRPAAREGDIFDREIADFLRVRLARAFADEEGVLALFASELDDPEDRPTALAVNGFYPWEGGPPRWRALFWALPSLPEELEYRISGRDLVLLDVRARLVVDIVRDALR